MDIIIETFDFELLNSFLNLLEQGTLNKSLSDEENLEKISNLLDSEINNDSTDCETLLKRRDLLNKSYVELKKCDELVTEILGEFVDHFRLIPDSSENVTKLILCIVLFYTDKTNLNKCSEMIYRLSALLSLKLLSFLSSYKIKDIYDKACKYYDWEHVEKIFGSKFTENENKFKILYKTLSSKKVLEDKKKYEISTTQCKPFKTHYTKPNSKHCDNESGKEEVTKYKFTATPIPHDLLYVDEDIAKKKEEEKMKKRQMDAQKLLEESNKNQFKCAKNIVKKKQNNTVQNNKDYFKVKKTEFTGYPDVEIKTNVTTTLREAANMIKEDEKFAKFLDDLANGSLSAYQYEDYIEEKRKEEELKDIEIIEKRRLEALITHEEAILAKRKLIEKNQAERYEFFRQWEEYEHQINEIREKELMKLRELYYQNTKQREINIQNKIQTIVEEKSQTVKEQNKKYKEEYERCVKELNEELDKKRDLIHQIRYLQEIQKINNQNKNKFDENEQPKHGFMYEMSLAELREKLGTMKIKIKEELERKRSEIKNEKIMKQNFLQNLNKFIQDTRNSKREMKKYQKEIRTEFVKNKDTNSDLKIKLLKMKQERLQKCSILKGN